MAYLETEPGHHIYYEHHAGVSRPVLLIHGWGMSGRVWDTTTAALIDAGHTVVTFDQRGCGASDKAFRDVSIEAGARDAAAVVRALGLDGVVIDGWSLGGAIAVAAATELGDVCAGLVLTGGATPRYVRGDGFSHGNPPGSVDAIVTELRTNRTPFLHGLAGTVCAKDPGPGVVEWLWQIFQQTSPAADAALAQLEHVDQRRLLAQLEVPVLSLAGTDDGFVPHEIARVAADTARDGRLVSFEGCGHAPFLEAGERYRHALHQFLQTLG